MSLLQPASAIRLVRWLQSVTSTVGSVNVAATMAAVTAAPVPMATLVTPTANVSDQTPKSHGPFFFFFLTTFSVSTLITYHTSF